MNLIPRPSAPDWFEAGLQAAEEYLLERFGRPLPLDVRTCLDLNLRHVREEESRIRVRAASLPYDRLCDEVRTHLVILTLQSACIIAARRERCLPTEIPS